MFPEDEEHVAQAALSEFEIKPVRRFLMTDCNMTFKKM
jgi:hypothetical protein